MMKQMYLDFSKKKAPETSFGLPVPFPQVPACVFDTNTEFLLRIALEGRDILDRGDSQLDKFRFTGKDVDRVYHGFQILLKLVTTGELSQDDEARLALLPDSLLAISTYYEDKLKALEETSNAASEKLPILRRKFQAMAVSGDFKNLLKEYPHFSALIEMDENIPETPAGTINFEQQRQDRAILDAFRKEVSTSPFWLGRTEIEDYLEHKIELCTANSYRNSRVLRDIRIVASQLSSLSGIRPTSAHIIPFSPANPA